MLYWVITIIHLYLFILHPIFSVKKFPRWLRGSCIEAPPQTVPGQDEPVKFTFYSDVSMHPEINELGGHVQESIRGGISQLISHANTWKKFKPLWRMQRV